MKRVVAFLFLLATIHLGSDGRMGGWSFSLVGGETLSDAALVRLLIMKSRRHRGRPRPQRTFISQHQWLLLLSD